ncbi:hypothetical protein GCM10011511_00710 [Puia dinghuensis]|uniref:DUF4239 domain-containing protein n=2 Tax=Puia dinghuensis TaxID=1792502 RepID=A0A8J2XPQ2_9BACT|nr:hypothetical protein GCM10011511_00710 [Puia dinghuensis]
MFNHFYLAACIFLLCITAVFLLVKKNPLLKRFSLDLDIGGIIYGGIVAVYSILLAFIVVIVWQQYQNTGDRIQEESTKVFNLYRASYAFPDSTTGKKIRTTVINYVTSVVNDEFPSMENDTTSAITQKRYNQVWDMVYAIRPQTDNEKVWYASMVTSINQFAEARSIRISDIDPSLPPLMWKILIAGGLIIILFAILFKTNNNKTHYLKIILFSVIIVFNLILVNMLDHPYKGMLKIEPSAFTKILKHYKEEQK